MVQYPCDEKNTAKPGLVEDVNVTTLEAKRDERIRNNNGKRKFGWISTISADNAKDFWGERGTEVLKFLKG